MKYPPREVESLAIIKCFSEMEYRNAFIRGEIYFKASGYFRKLEDDFRGDIYDGKRPVDEGILQPTMTFKGQTTAIHDLTYGFDGDDKLPIFCASCVNSNILIRYGKNQYGLKKEFIQEMRKFGDYFAIIPITSFFNRIEQVCKENSIGYVIKEVEYINLKKIYSMECLQNMEPVDRIGQYQAFFHKDLSYKWQNEIRVILDSPDGKLIGTNDFFVLHIGQLLNVKTYNGTELENLKINIRWAFP